MFTTSELQSMVKAGILKATSEVNELAANKGKYHNLMSKAFVAGVSEYLKQHYTDADVHFQNRGWNRELQECTKGEWMVDLSVVRKIYLSSKANCIAEIVLAMESEFDSGDKAFFEDFSKLLTINAKEKLYINGIGAKNRKKQYIERRINLLKEILNKTKSDETYYLCFVDRPDKWKGGSVDNVYIGTYQISAN